jgi:hypothetical protein
MTTKKWVETVSVCLLLSTGPGIAQNAVTDWGSKAGAAIVAGRPPASSQVLLGMLYTAVYDAVMAVEGGYPPIAVSPSANKPASSAAAAATAAYLFTRAYVPAQAALLEAEYSAYLAALPEGAAKTNGIAVGKEVAEKFLALRANDGYDSEVVFVQPSKGAGVWEPTAPTPAVDVKLKQVRPLTLTSPAQFRPQPPLPLSSAAYARDLKEVRDLGAEKSTLRSATHTETALFWGEHAAAQWNRNLLKLAVSKGLNLQDSARMMAMAYVPAADAIIGCMEAKYFYNFWRPVQAIRQTDTAWTALLNVNFPEYPSAHACVSTAIVEGLTAFFGSDQIAFVVDSTTTKTIRNYARLSDVVKEVTEARILAGLHYRFSMEAGNKLGAQVAQWVLSRHFKPR